VNKNSNRNSVAGTDRRNHPIVTGGERSFHYWGDCIMDLSSVQAECPALL